LGRDGKEGKDREEEESQSLLPFPFLSSFPSAPKNSGRWEKKGDESEGNGSGG